MTAPKKKSKITSTMHFRAYGIIANAVQMACDYSGQRCFKYCDAPTPEVISTTCYDQVMLELCEVIDFGNDYET